MQGFSSIMGLSSLISRSLNQIKNNDLVALSNSAGTSFPRDNLHVGQSCYRTDEGKRYILTDVVNEKWEETVPVSATVGIASDAIRIIFHKKKWDGPAWAIVCKNGMSIQWGIIKKREIPQRTGYSESNMPRWSRSWAYFPEHLVSVKSFVFNRVFSVDDDYAYAVDADYACEGVPREVAAFLGNPSSYKDGFFLTDVSRWIEGTNNAEDQPGQYWSGCEEYSSDFIWVAIGEVVDNADKIARSLIKQKKTWDNMGHENPYYEIIYVDETGL